METLTLALMFVGAFTLARLAFFYLLGFVRAAAKAAAKREAQLRNEEEARRQLNEVWKRTRVGMQRDHR